MKKIDIMFCFNRNAWMQAAVAINSLIKNARNKCTYNIHIVCPPDVDSSVKTQLTQLLLMYPGNNIDFTVPPEELLQDAKVKQPWHKIFFFRLLAPKLFPTLNKIIYFDTDIIFTKDLVELDNIKVQKPVAAVVDYWYPRLNESIYNKYGVYDLFDKCKYINSGMLVMNLDLMRKQNILDKCLELIKTEYLPIFDQDCINIVCKNNIQYIPMKFNRGAYYTTEYCEKYRRILGQSEQSLSDDLNNYAVLHYIGFKPEGIKTIGQWHNDIWWSECAQIPWIYDIMRRRQNTEMENFEHDKLKNKKIYNRLKTFLFKVVKTDTKSSCYVCGIRCWTIKNRLAIIKSKFPSIMPFEVMLQKIKNGASLARFGDAEFDIALQRNKDDPYQKPSDKLSNKLLEILRQPSDDKLIVCIPPFNATHNNIKNFRDGLSFWEWYWRERWKMLSPYFVNKLYGNSFFSRDAVFYELTLDELKSIWNKRNVCFVVPENGRFEYDERIFKNIKSKTEIYIPATSAFDDYDRIIAECTKQPKNTLFFIAAGPTATVLAYDLSKSGYQALDMGHFTNCYKQYLGEAKQPEAYPMQKETKNKQV